MIFKADVKNKNLKKITLSALLIAIGVALSFFSFPVGIARIFPFQHMINVIAGVILGPFYAVLAAFGTSLIRNIMGTGSLLAFPGSMIGALLAGVLYKTSGKILLSSIGELIGTGLIGAIVAFPVARFIIGNEAATLFLFVVPFGLSSLAGSAIGFIVLKASNLIGILKLI
ncbi:MAG: energy coupling factor transporter S component ThiW [Defluviitaleaceae bacterium]|nr:energy coupling factor transporter S component ThiW [Defluviitaleaceae bacterium]